jgi:hypothetical protein
MPYPLGHGATCHLQRLLVCVAVANVFAVCMVVSLSLCSVLRLRCIAHGARVVCGGACVCVCVAWFRVLRAKDTLAEWLRRRPAKPMGSPRVGSNPTGVGLQFAALRRLGSAEVDVQKRGCSGN